MPTITVRDVMRLALPAETSVVAGVQGVSHQVSWVATLRATPPAFVNLRGGEIALVPVAGIAALDERMTLASLIERLAGVPIAAVAVVGTVGETARNAADEARIPLLHLPEATNLREVERELQRLLSDYEAQIERRAAQFGNLLTQRALAGAGMAGLLDTLAERTGQAVACYSPIGETRAIRGRGPARVALQTLRPGRAGMQSHLGQQIWVQPMGAGGDRLGFVALAGTTLDDWDQMAAQAAAAAIALELAKEQAVQAAEERLRGDFVQAVLMGPPGDTEALLRRGQELGYDLRQPYAALLCSVLPGQASNGPDEAAAARAATLLGSNLAAMGIAAPTMRRDDGALAYLPLSEQIRARELAERLRTKIAGDLPHVVLALGKEAPSVALWPRSLREAEQALRIGRQLFDTSRVLDYGDLGVYRLLLLLREQPELWEFYRTTLAPLADYDREQRAELLKTLEAFFDNLGNLARTAEALHIHRNTLLYRIGRIKDISGLDTEDPEDRLSLWLALKAHRVLRTLDEIDSEN